MAIQPTDGWTDEVLMREIRAGGARRNKAWEYVYKAWRGYYLSPLLKMGASLEIVDDVIGQVIMDVEKQILKPDFQFHSTSFSVYFTTCLKRACAKAMALANENDEFPASDPQINSQGGNSVEQDYLNRELLDQVLGQLGDKCKTVLLMFGQGYSMREIAEHMHYSNEQTVKNLRSSCLQKLIELTKNH